jgi:hypothetical protein
VPEEFLKHLSKKLKVMIALEQYVLRVSKSDHENSSS